MRDQDCHPFGQNYWIGSWLVLNEGSKLPPPLANVLNRILAWTDLEERSKLPLPSGQYIETDLNLKLSSLRYSFPCSRSGITLEELRGWEKIKPAFCGRIPGVFNSRVPVSDYISVSECNSQVSEYHSQVSEYHSQFPNTSFRIPLSSFRIPLSSFWIPLSSFRIALPVPES